MSSSNVIINLKSKFNEPLMVGYQRRVVFWVDEEKQFEDDFDHFEFEGVKKHKITGSNIFATKLLLEYENLTDDFLVYSPFAYDKKEKNYLSDIMLYSEEFKADFVSLIINDLQLEDTIQMRKVIKQYNRFFKSNARIEKLKGFDCSFKRPIDLEYGIFAVLANVREVDMVLVLLRLLEDGLNKVDNEFYVQLEKFADLEAFASIIEIDYGFQNFKERELLHFWAHLSCTGSYHIIKELNNMADVKDFINTTYSIQCYSAMNEMIHDSYKDNIVREMLIKVEDFLLLPERLVDIAIEELVGLELLPVVNSVLFNKFVDSLIEKQHQPTQIKAMISKRRELKWYNRNSAFYEAVNYATNIIQYVNDHTSGLSATSLLDVWNHYQQDYYLMDQYYRHFVYHTTKAISQGDIMFDDGLKELASYIEKVYKNWYLDLLGKRWSSAIEEYKYNFDEVNIIHQRNFYNQFVANYVGDGIRTFVIISDAMRYEIAKELCGSINQSIKGNASLSAMVAQVPSITKIGMAALLPHDEIKFDGETVLVDGMRSDGLDNRAKILKKRVAESEAIQANRFIEMRRQERNEFVKGKKLIYIYHNQIDTIGDNQATESQVFDASKKTIADLQNILRVLVNEFEAKNVFITADHGFIYTHNPLREFDRWEVSDYKIDNNLVNRRFIITDQILSDDGMHKVDLREIGCNRYLLAPKLYSRFKVSGGGNNYVHGGLSIQELMVPVISYKSSRSDVLVKDFKKVGLELLNEVHKITGLVFNLSFFQSEALGDKMLPLRAYVQFEDIHGNAISDRKIIIADRTSLNAQDRQFKQQFTLKNQKYDEKATYYCVIGEQDDNTNPVIEKIKFEISVLFSGDFDF